MTPEPLTLLPPVTRTVAVSVNTLEADSAASDAVALTLPCVRAVMETAPLVVETPPPISTVAVDADPRDRGSSALLTATSRIASASRVMLPLVATSEPSTWIDAVRAVSASEVVTCVASCARAVRETLPAPVLTVKPLDRTIDSAATTRPPLSVRFSLSVTESAPSSPCTESATAPRLEASSKMNASSPEPRLTLIVPVDRPNAMAVYAPVLSHRNSRTPEPLTRRFKVSAPELPEKLSVEPVMEYEPPSSAEKSAPWSSGATSIAPVVYSSAQSPARAALPVASVDAATSAPVIAAKRCTNSMPGAPPATSQP